MEKVLHKILTFIIFRQRCFLFCDSLVFSPEEFASIQKAIQLPLPHVLEPKPLAPFLLAMMGAKPSA